MDSPITRFAVSGLFGRTDVALVLDDGQLVLVGENGSGKSTVVSLLYFALTGQWARMADLSFSSISLTIAGKCLIATKEDIVHHLQTPDRPRGAFGYIQRRLGPSRFLLLNEELKKRPANHWLNHQDQLQKIATQYHIVKAALVDYLLEGDFEITPKHEAQFKPEVWDSTIKDHLHAQVLFLPTYRRIERDLKGIFPSLNIEPSLREFQEKQEHTRSARGYIELVEFGMTDVDRVRARTTAALDRAFRDELSRLAGEYLRDIIRNDYQGTKSVDLSDPLIAQDLSAILARIPDDILLASDREALRRLIAESGAQPRSRQRNTREAILSHYVSKLLALQTKQKQREAPVRQFADICNEYLNEKKVVFDSTAFDVSLVETPSGVPQSTNPLTPRKIPLSGLSSGEKQIVSLFAHVILSGEGPYFLIIDEPELSISVDWQKRFLTDLIATGLCVGLVAVTHSPFVFQNSLQDKAHSMSEFSHRRV